MEKSRWKENVGKEIEEGEGLVQKGEVAAPGLSSLKCDCHRGTVGLAGYVSVYIHTN